MDQSDFEADNTRNCTLQSPVPEAAKAEPCWLGIDEAGRGPVLGPMVYGVCYSPLCMKQDLEELKFADSKTLTEEQRESIFEKLCEAKELIGWMIEVLSPTYISNSMLRRSKYSLNAVSHDSAIGLIEKVLAQGVNVAEIYVDTVGDPAKYQAKLKALFPAIDITVAKKADADYQIVGAASICAKVARDRAVKSWTFIEGIESDGSHGTGYPADPNTKRFLRETLDRVFGFPQFVRVSWSTAYRIIEQHAVTFRWEDDEEEENKNTQSLLKFMGKSDEKTNRHRFFKERCLSHVATL